jgi:hypothetical protein
MHPYADHWLHEPHGQQCARAERQTDGQRERQRRHADEHERQQQ